MWVERNLTILCEDDEDLQCTFYENLMSAVTLNSL